MSNRLLARGLPAVQADPADVAARPGCAMSACGKNSSI